MKRQIINCTALASLNATDKNIIMHQLKLFKQNIYPKSNQLDGMNYIYVSNNVLSITSRICKIWIAAQTVISDPDVCFIWSYHGKAIENALSSSYILFETTILHTSGDENEGDFSQESEYCTSYYMQNRYTNLGSLLITLYSSMMMHNGAMKHSTGCTTF